MGRLIDGISTKEQSPYLSFLSRILVYLFGLFLAMTLSLPAWANIPQRKKTIPPFIIEQNVRHAGSKISANNANPQTNSNASVNTNTANPADSGHAQSTPDITAKNARHSALIYSLLVAEMAAQRNMSQVAMRQFLELAKNTQDPTIAKEATEWAIEFQDPESAILAAKLWADTDTEDLQAQMVATTLLIGQSIQEATPYLKRAIELDEKEIGQQIVAIQARLSPRSAEQFKTALIRIAASQPKNPYSNLAAAQSAAQQEDVATANQHVDIALQLKPDLTAALQLKARLIRYGDETDARALKFLRDKVAQFDNNAELRLFYANALFDSNQNREASIHLKKLVDDKQYGGQALIFLGEIYRKQGDFAGSSEAWQRALKYDDSRQNAAYLLGELSEERGRREEAIKQYLDITSGPYHVAAQIRAADLFKKNKEYERAIAVLHDSNPTTTEEQKQLLLSEIDVYVAKRQLMDAIALAEGILEKLPNDEDTLLVYSNVAAKLGQWPLAEKSLKTILKQNPNNSDALNALGFVLVQTNRMEEAGQYLKQALALAPNNPSYLDSMGWYYYRAGNLEEALKHLRRAYRLSNDVEIASHLGEILWVSGQQEEAKEIWGKALWRNPEDEILLETLSRFKIEIKPTKVVDKKNIGVEKP